MKQAYFVRDPEKYSNKATLTYVKGEDNPYYLIFNEGIKLPAPNQGRIPYSQDPITYNIIFDSEVTKERLLKFDILPNSVGLPLVNRRCLKILQDLCPEDFQAFPAVIRNQNDKIPAFENHDYSLINIAVNVQGYDPDKCEIKLNEYGNIGNLYDLVLDDRYMDGHHLARLTLYRPVFIASSTLVEVFKKEKIKGFRFVHRYGD